MAPNMLTDSGSATVKLSPQKIAILCHTIFMQFEYCWRSMQFLLYSAIFAQLLLNCLLAGRDQPVTANVILIMEKGVDATPSRQFAATHVTQSPGAQRFGAVLSPKLIGLPVAGHFCIHTLLLSARRLITGMTDNSEHKLRSWKSLHMICVMNSWDLINHYYLLSYHLYHYILIESLSLPVLREIGCGMTSVVDWSLIVAKDELAL